MNILLLGSGGREHALSTKLAESPLCKNLYVAPGNAGTKDMATNIPLNVNDFDAVKQQLLALEIDMLVVGPEDPLVNGITDFVKANEAIQHVKVVGPSKAGAALEGSKERAKQFMEQHQIPTAKYKSFNKNEVTEAQAFLDEMQSPYVLKADGLAAGKGVLIIEGKTEAKREIEAMLTENKFGKASEKLVIEEFLSGIELSVFVLTDGKNYLTLPNAKDYKRIGEGDTGLNTGGMGAISPVPFADEAFMKHVDQDIVQPTIRGLAEEKIDYKGFVFIGLMKVGDKAFVIEYNVRMGDPETEVVIPRIQNDLVEVLTCLDEQKLNEVNLKIDERTAATLMLVSGGYPEAYEKGKVITGINSVKDTKVYHAGTKYAENGNLLTNGGRVLALTSFGKDYSEALQKSYASAEKIEFEGKYYRTDLGKDLA
ncbi:phosphoribosylamine--glycine ligase [Psychroflexus planctonicus]|uniref:Phosphoribosylamine--glycine ligase n=1 Tax=Psychroflexus planctonicus TaxID=1526575 RepID=A0ABQ1SK24_9FLAO|nr:phosphoribosylamine--glycine ligase [Psychroflexus planctonicus]GGE40720.1 phosphoribosylamine--glycine ligase [Psychroflexus planctonicus]